MKIVTSKRRSNNAENEAVRQSLIQRFTALAPGEMVEHPVLTKELTNGQNWLVQSAIKAVQKAEGCIIANVRGRGYQKLPTGQFAGFTARGREVATRKIIRTKAVATRALRENDASMSKDDRLAVNKELGILGLMAEISKG
jgi:hypothetical protein